MNASVIIPTYNRSDILAKSIESWINQSISNLNYEIIIVDNNSSDNTAEVADRYVQKYKNIKYIKEERAGATYARHTAAKHAKSEHLIYTDDDGIYNDTCIEEILNVYNMHSDVVAVGGRIDILWDKTPPDWVLPLEGLLGRMNLGNEVIIGKDINLYSGLLSIKKSILYELNGFNPDLIGGYLVGDGDTGLVIKIHKKKYLIGWTPHAKMLHMQFVDKHATVKDIGRRYYNIGVSDSYGKLRANDFKFNIAVFKYLIRTLLFGSKKIIEYHVIRNTNKRYKNYFSLMHRKGQLAFLAHLSSKQFRESYKSDNWF